MNDELITKEIALRDDECCIIFDFGFYYPFDNTDDFSRFGFSLGMRDCDDVRLNHRYSNKNYYTISRKDGRKVSKLGYPIVMKLDQQYAMLLDIAISAGVSKKFAHLVFPVVTEMTKEKPYCFLSMHYNTLTSDICFTTYDATFENDRLIGWTPVLWSRKDIADNFADSVNSPLRVSSNLQYYNAVDNLMRYDSGTVLDIGDINNENHTAVFSTIVKPISFNLR